MIMTENRTLFLSDLREIPVSALTHKWYQVRRLRLCSPTEPLPSSGGWGTCSSWFTKPQVNYDDSKEPAWWTRRPRVSYRCVMCQKSTGSYEMMLEKTEKKFVSRMSPQCLKPHPQRESHDWFTPALTFCDECKQTWGTKRLGINWCN